MKAAQLDKLYAKLTPQEQAGLVVEAAARQDESTIDTILARLERGSYALPCMPITPGTYTRYLRLSGNMASNIGRYGF